jgi:hypothetical protein
LGPTPAAPIPNTTRPKSDSDCACPRYASDWNAAWTVITDQLAGALDATRQEVRRLLYPRDDGDRRADSEGNPQRSPGCTAGDAGQTPRSRRSPGASTPASFNTRRAEWMALSRTYRSAPATSRGQRHPPVIGGRRDLCDQASVSCTLPVFTRVANARSRLRRPLVRSCLGRRRRLDFRCQRTHPSSGTAGCSSTYRTRSSMTVPAKHGTTVLGWRRSTT